MKAKKKEFREPEHFFGAAPVNNSTKELMAFYDHNCNRRGPDGLGNKYVSVVVIRERDYQRLLKAARRRKGK
jgi:hypothetical protein